MWGSIAFMLTSMTMGALWQQTGFQVMFVISGFCLGLVSLAAFLLDETPPAPASAPGSAAVKIGLPEPGILFLLAAGFLVVGSLFMNGIFGSVYMTLIGGTEMHVGALFGLAAMGEVPGMLFGRRLARRIGDTNTLLIACVITAIGSGGYAFATTPNMLLAFGVLRGLGFGTYLVSTVTILNHRAPANMYATYQSLVNAVCWGLAPLLGGPTAGYIYENFGPATLFTISGSMAFVAAILLLPTYRLWRTPPQPLPLVTGESPADSQ
jgi:PPP family 3-phenylpropionic acid transporter